MKLIDRMVLWAYIRSYVICLVSLLSLYVIIDLFTNLDDFFQDGRGVWAGLNAIGRYYLYRSAQIFDRLCEAIILLAGAFTVGWMQRSNELLPLLSGGVPTRRILRPIFMGAILFLALGVANQELVIPRIADMLTRQRDDLNAEKDVAAQCAYDPTGVHLEGHIARRSSQTIRPFHCTIPDAQGSGLLHLSATEAQYIPPGEGPWSGGWLLRGTSPAVVPEWDHHKLARMVSPGQWFVYTKDVDFESMTRHGSWYMLNSTRQLYRLLTQEAGRRLEPLAVVFHMRLTRPILGLLLLVMGLAIILRDPHRHIFVSAGWCLVLCAIYFGVTIGCKFLGDHEILSPIWAAWLPVIAFVPTAIVMFDSIYT
jgi:lipopolysaccharide export system permease protein